MTEMVAPAAGERKLYARKSSGLIRTIGVFGAMVFGVHCISLSSSGLIPYSWIAGVWPGSSIIGVLTVAAIFCLFHAYTYGTMVLPTRSIVRILQVGFFLGLLAWVILYFQLGTASPTAFPAAWDRFMGAGSYDARIGLAEQYGMQINPNVAVMTLAGLIMGFWVFYGYYIPTFFAGEVKQAENTLLAGSWASLLVTWAIFVVGALLLQRLVPLEWLAAESYLSNIGYEGPTMPWITFYAAVLRPSFPLILFFAFCTMLVPVLAITLFPFLKPDLYQNASAAVRRSIGGFPLITIVGT